jgi:hypothetical protein
MRRRAVLAASFAVLLAGCAAPAAGAVDGAGPRAAPAAPDAAERLPVRVEFEPPLRAPGELRYACESGFAGVVAAPPTGVDLRLPSGPATFTLVADGATRELAVAVAPGMAPVRWPLAPALRIRAGDGIVDADVAARTARR